jgi:hypothetical protein
VNAPDIPRGRYKGERVGAPVTDEAEHFIRCPACGGGLIAANLLKCSSTKGRCRIRRRIGRNDKKKPRYESRVEVIAGSRLPLCPRMSNLEGTPLLLSRADDSR